MWASSILQPVSLVVHLPEVADVDQWSERMRQPFVEVYGEENFCRLWEGWGKAIRNYFTQRNGESLSFFFFDFGIKEVIDKKKMDFININQAETVSASFFLRVQLL